MQNSKRCFSNDPRTRGSRFKNSIHHGPRDISIHLHERSPRRGRSTRSTLSGTLSRDCSQVWTFEPSHLPTYLPTRRGKSQTCHVIASSRNPPPRGRKRVASAERNVGWNARDRSNKSNDVSHVSGTTSHDCRETIEATVRPLHSSVHSSVHSSIPSVTVKNTILPYERTTKSFPRFPRWSMTRDLPARWRRSVANARPAAQRTRVCVRMRVRERERRVDRVHILTRV